jgi:acyl carrier protein
MVGTRVTIVNPDTRMTCPYGEIGEIWVNGPSVAKGYWGNSDDTDFSFNAYTSSGAGPFLRTGDLGFIDSGQLYVSGRLKNLIIIRGMNHYPHEIEATTSDCHEAIMTGSCVAFSVEQANQEKLVIVAELKRSFLRNPPGEEIFTAIRQAVADNHQLQVHAIVLTKTGSNPKTSSGKIQHFECRNSYLSGELDKIISWTAPADGPLTGTGTPGENEISTWIKNWMARELQLDPAEIEPDKPVAAYGLDSLKAVMLASDAEAHFGIEWPLDAFLEETTVEKLAVKGRQLLSDKDITG